MGMYGSGRVLFLMQKQILAKQGTDTPRTKAATGAQAVRDNYNERLDGRSWKAVGGRPVCEKEE